MTDDVLKDPQKLRDLLFAAHDLLHKGDADAAHELLHSVCGDMAGVTVTTTPVPAQRQEFDLAFRTACRKHKVLAAYLLLLPDPQPGHPNRVGLHVGGAVEPAGMIDSMLAQHAQARAKAQHASPILMPSKPKLVM